MSKNEEYSEFLNSLLSCSLKNLQTTKEYAYLKGHQEHMDELLRTTLTKNQKDVVDEVFLECKLAAEHETELLYYEGLKDCVWLLKSLGVLA